MMVVSTETVQQSPNVISRNSNEFQPPQPPKRYLWMPANLKGQKLQDKTDFSRKQSFLSSESHRLRKAKQLERLRASIKPLPAQSSRLCATDREREISDTPHSKTDQAGLVVQVDHAFGIGVQAAFPSFKISTSTSLDFYFKYYEVYTSRACFPLSSAHMTTICTQASKDLPVLMLVLLSAAASSRAASLIPRGDSAREVRRIMHDSLKMRAQAIESLQVAFKRGLGSAKVALFWTITILLGLEAAEGNLKAAIAHVDGVKMMAAMLGGLDDGSALSHEMSTLMLFADVMIGMNSDSPIIFHATPKWERRAVANSIPLMMDEYSTGSPILGTAFFTSPWTGVIPAELKDVIQSLQMFIPRHEQSLHLGNVKGILETDFLVMLARQLLVVPLSIRLDPFQETIRLSIFIYFTTRIWSFDKKPCTVNLVRRLRNNLDGCLDQFQALAPDLLFWIFFMGCLASHGSVEFAWAAHGLRECAGSLCILEWSEALSILEAFLFVLRKGDIARDIWVNAQSMGRRSITTGGGTSYPFSSMNIV